LGGRNIEKQSYHVYERLRLLLAALNFTSFSQGGNNQPTRDIYGEQTFFMTFADVEPKPFMLAAMP
jgi:hypothetical protein